MPPVRREVCRKRENCQLEGADDGDVWLFISEGALYLPWYNIISKEIGPCRMINAIPELGQPRLIILPQGTSLKGIEIEILLRWVEKGVALFCECPGEDLAGLTGLRYTGEKYHCHKEEFLGAVLDLSGASSLVYRPLREKNIAAAKPDFLFENSIGLGVVFTLSIEYCRWATDITQGKLYPPGARFPRKLFRQVQGIQTPDLAGEGREDFIFAPVLDIFDQLLLRYVRDKLKIPSWWYYPGKKSCAFALTFDEDWFGERADRFPLPGIPATWFLTDDSNIDTRSLHAMQEDGKSFQMHWNRFIIHLNRFGWRFCFRDIKEQMHRISQKISNKPVACRIHYLRWDAHYDNLFFVMKEAGINLDSSFGPGRGQHGYRFATGYPYLVSDKRGRPIGIEEIPFQIHQPQGGASVEEVLRLLEEAKRDYHTFLVGLFHPYDCLPGRQSYESYTKLLELLDDESIWCTDIENLSVYWNKRRERVITSVFKEQELVVRISGLPEKQMTLRLPDGENIERIIFNKKEIPVTDKIVLDNGEQSLIVKYRNQR
ncbi:MAG: hypothetical protein PHQ57_04640 [Candidatus Omnitrophica bacterium]|nr:hypothetical protein [Candidatus Omnitrophota bacterium]